jgi:hypothetical protein
MSERLSISDLPTALSNSLFTQQQQLPSQHAQTLLVRLNRLLAGYAAPVWRLTAPCLPVVVRW